MDTLKGGRGGYREGSGRAKTGYYKGVYCGSTYELCWVIYQIDHNIRFNRFPGRLSFEGVIYYPDFLLSDDKTIVEIKGYESEESVERKSNVARQNGYDVIVLRKDDLQSIFKYVETTYQTKKFHTLYDDYRPSYAYKCDYCGEEFKADRRRRTELVFCCRFCAGKFRKRVNHNDAVYRKISSTLTGRTRKPYKLKNKYKWITDGTRNTRILYDLPIPEGFWRGRC